MCAGGIINVLSCFVCVVKLGSHWIVPHVVLFLTCVGVLLRMKFESLDSSVGGRNVLLPQRRADNHCYVVDYGDSI